MGCKVKVRSRPGEGSTFTLWLPAPLPSARAPRPTPPESLLATRRANGGGDGVADAFVMEGWYRSIGALGSALASDIESVAQHLAARLRADGSLPNMRTLPEAQLRDHVTTTIAEIAHVLTVLGETEGRAPELLRDGSEILRVVAELHGAQRHRLGWGEPHFAQESELLFAEIVTTLRRASIAGALPGDALTLATALVQRLLEQSRQTSLRSFRVAQQVGAI